MPGACQSAGRSPSAFDDRERRRGRAAPAVTLVVARSACVPRRWHDGEYAGYAEEPGRLPADRHAARGPGLPDARLVVLLSLATAMVHDMAMGPYAGKKTGEAALLRELVGQLGDGDILLADRYYCSYFMMALLQNLRVDCVARLHQNRRADFRRGRRLGPGDHVVTWVRPARPEWMDKATYQRMPAELRVREVVVQVRQPGFRVDSFVVATTLTDATRTTKEAVGELYHRRWLVELDIRSIKVTLGMDVLRCQSPAMVRRRYGPACWHTT